jgi:hypothetical protein
MLPLRDKKRLEIENPPIEIGGYKYIVPNGIMREIRDYLTKSSVKMAFFMFSML